MIRKRTRTKNANLSDNYWALYFPPAALPGNNSWDMFASKANGSHSQCSVSSIQTYTVFWLANPCPLPSHFRDIFPP